MSSWHKDFFVSHCLLCTRWLEQEELHYFSLQTCVANVRKVYQDSWSTFNDTRSDYLTSEGSYIIMRLEPAVIRLVSFLQLKEMSSCCGECKLGKKIQSCKKQWEKNVQGKHFQKYSGKNTEVF